MNWEDMLILRLRTFYEEAQSNANYLPEHWFDHALRVEKLALWLIKEEILEKLVDSDIVIATALLHDSGYLLSDGHGHIKNSCKLARLLLPQSSFPSTKLSKTIKCIRYHDTVPNRPGWKDNVPIECKIVRDADAIESSGCLGILRFAYWSGRNRTPLWIPNGEDSKSSVFPEIGVINNIEIRLPELIDRCFSSTAREVIQQRWKVMQKFIEGFKQEIQFIQNI